MNVQTHIDTFESPNTYENRVVVFIDVLGWSEEIEASISNAAVIPKLGLVQAVLRNSANKEQRLKEMLERIGVDADHIDGRGSQLSDSIVLSYPWQPVGTESKIAFDIQTLTSIVMDNGFLIRGAITAGPLIHSDVSVYGPALVEAVRLEKKAVFPRVIVSPELASQWGMGTPIFAQSGQLLGNFKYWRQDSDGFRFFDFLQHMHAFQPANASQPAGHPPFKPVLTKVRHFIADRLTQFRQDARKYEKYVWLARYFNSVIKEWSITDIEPLAFDET